MPSSSTEIGRRMPDDEQEARDRLRCFRQARWKELQANSDSLLKESQNLLPHLESEVACVHPTLPVIITSPNKNYVPFLPLSPSHTVRLRGDCRFGLEDHHQIPQMVCPGSIHNVLIRTCVEHGLFSCLWTTPRPNDFTANAAATGIGQYSEAFLIPIRTLAGDILRSAETTLFTQRTKPLSIHLASIIRSLTHFLTSVPLTRNRAFLCLRLFQRSILELDALIGVQELLPYLNSEVPLPDAYISANRHVIGGWTSDLLSAEKLHRLSIPLWIVRPAEQSDSVSAKKIQPFPRPPSTVNISPSPINLPVVFDGLQADTSKYRSILEFVRQNTILLPTMTPTSISATPFKMTMHSVPLPSTSRVPLTGAHRQPKRDVRKGQSRSLPKTPRSNAMHPEEAVHVLLSRPLPVWEVAFESTLQDDNLVHLRDGSKDDAYHLPPPSLFVSSQSATNSSNFLSNWLRLRVCIYVSLSTPKNVGLSDRSRLKYQSWCGLLFNPSEIFETGRVASSSKPSNRDKIREREVLRVLQDLREGDDEVSLSVESTRVVWFGRTFAYLLDDSDSVQMCREILWEVGEMGFRMDLILLDSRLSSSRSETHRRIHLERCFPLGELSVLTVDLGCGQSGLNNPDWRHRGAFVFALREMMKCWDVRNLPSHITQDREGGYSAEEYAETEASVAWCFCQNFFFNFGRMPNIPCILNELPPTDRVLTSYSQKEFIINDDGKWLPPVF